jgi:hypothetical protein
LVVAPPAGADPAPEGVAAAAALTEDHSNEMPRTRHNEVTGYFVRSSMCPISTCRGYDQRAVVENGNLNIYDSAANGGGLLRSALTDLHEPLTDGDYSSVFSLSWKTTAKDNTLGAVPLAWTPGRVLHGRLPDGPR